MAKRSEDEAKKLLQAAFEQHLRLGFPRGSRYENATELHGLLVEYDSYVAGRISTLLGNGRLFKRDLEPDVILRQRIEALARSHVPGSSDARRYLDHFQHLEALLTFGRGLVP